MARHRVSETYVADLRALIVDLEREHDSLFESRRSEWIKQIETYGYPWCAGNNRIRSLSEKIKHLDLRIKSRKIRLEELESHPELIRRTPDYPPIEGEVSGQIMIPIKERSPAG